MPEGPFYWSIPDAMLTQRFWTLLGIVHSNKPRSFNSFLADPKTFIDWFYMINRTVDLWSVLNIKLSPQVFFFLLFYRISRTKYAQRKSKPPPPPPPPLQKRALIRTIVEPLVPFKLAETRLDDRSCLRFATLYANVTVLLNSWDFI